MKILILKSELDKYCSQLKKRANVPLFSSSLGAFFAAKYNIEINLESKNKQLFLTLSSMPPFLFSKNKNPSYPIVAEFPHFSFRGDGKRMKNTIM